MYCSCLCVPVNPPMDQAYMTMSLSWKPSLCIANWITTSMALASFWGNGTPWQKDTNLKKQYLCIIKQNSHTQPTNKSFQYQRINRFFSVSFHYADSFDHGGVLALLCNANQLKPEFQHA